MEIKPIGWVSSDFEGRFGTPRQPGIVPSAQGEVHLQAPFNHPDALRGLTGCSHIWLIFGFHATRLHDWRPTVRPPRLGGNQRLGVFATRSPFRPNGLGLSLVRLLHVIEASNPRLAIAGHDLLDQTPVYDIKPYLPEIECQTNATPPPHFAIAQQALAIRWTTAAAKALPTQPDRLQAVIEQTIAADPRPAYQQDSQRRYAMRLLGHEVAWRVEPDCAVIETLSPVSD